MTAFSAHTRPIREAPRFTPMASIMRGVWAQFARTGDPAIEGFPKWEAFTRENGVVMVLDRVPYLNEQHDATLIGLLKPGYEW